MFKELEGLVYSTKVWKQFDWKVLFTQLSWGSPFIISKDTIIRQVVWFSGLIRKLEYISNLVHEFWLGNEVSSSIWIGPRKSKEEMLRNIQIILVKIYLPVGPLLKFRWITVNFMVHTQLLLCRGYIRLDSLLWYVKKGSQKDPHIDSRFLGDVTLFKSSSFITCDDW